MNLKKIFLSITILFSIFTQLYSQSVENADTLFQMGDYKNAYVLYNDLFLTESLPQDSSFFKAGKCAYLLGKYDEAILFLDSLRSPKLEKKILLGDSYLKNYFFEKAILQFEEFLLAKDTVDYDYHFVEKKLQQAKLGQKYLQRVENIVFIDSIVVPQNEAIKKILLSKEIGTFTQRKESLNDKPIDLVSFTTERGNKTYNPTIYDNEIDLRLDETLLNGQVETQKIKDLSSPYNENYPFLTLDGVTLYFSSNNSNSMGGYDIFVTQLNHSDNQYIKPENIGMPFNSPFNDYVLAIDEVEKLGWLVSDRYQKEGNVVVYRFVPNDEKIIVKTEDLDSLRRRAKISTFNKTAYKSPVIKKINIEDKSLILIKDNLYYEKVSDFKSKEAQKYYYQSKSIEKSILEAKKSLRILRKKYYNLKTGKEKEKISEKIIMLEKYLLEQVPLQKNLEKEMRNLEIKKLKHL